jgi:hypothetical protein
MCAATGSGRAEKEGAELSAANKKVVDAEEEIVLLKATIKKLQSQHLHLRRAR